MAVTLTDLQIQLGKAMGLSNPNSQNDLNQINAFAKANGVNNLNSQNDLNALLPKVQTPYETSPGSNQWVNPNNVLPGAGSYAGAPIVQPLAPGALPGTAANGSSSSFDFQSLLMQQQASLAAQNQAFQLAQQQFAQQQALQQAAMAEQLQAAMNAATPGAVTGAGQSTSGWKPAEGGKSTLESLLLGTQAATGAMQLVTA